MARLSFCLFCLAVTTSLMAQDETEKELKKMEGSWKVIGSQVDNIRIPLEAYKKVVIMIKGEKIQFKDGDKIYDEIEIDIDPATTPKEIDYHYLAGLKKGVRERGIYELDGDRLKICMAQPKQKRPTEFASKKGTGQQLLILKRMSP
jgi:uncharacterized protein (TIGR03067 family)